MLGVLIAKAAFQKLLVKVVVLQIRDNRICDEATELVVIGMKLAKALISRNLFECFVVGSKLVFMFLIFSAIQLSQRNSRAH